MSEKLKPCPFCGKTPELKAFYSAKSAYYFVECRNFDCSMYCYTKKSFGNYVDAIEAWNRREGE